MWQELMIWLARNEKVKLFFQSRRNLIQLATRFVGGKDEQEAVELSKYLLHRDIYTSLFFLGEYVIDRAEVERTMNSLFKTIGMLADNGLDVHVSVDPTQIGLQISKAYCFENLENLALKIKECAVDTSRKNFLMIDMEDASVCADTVSFYQELVQKELPVALTLQAYMFRTANDLKPIIQSGGAVRLVKGAFAENKAVALTSKKDIDEAYFELSKQMLSPEAKASGFYPVFATHDDRMIDKINRLAAENSWQKNEYEFEMLYGVRTDYQNELVSEGYKLRLYLPYGKDWWAYAIRRVGENPKNIKYLLKLK